MNNSCIAPAEPKPKNKQNFEYPADNTNTSFTKPTQKIQKNQTKFRNSKPHGLLVVLSMLKNRIGMHLHLVLHTRDALAFHACMLMIIVLSLGRPHPYWDNPQKGGQKEDQDQVVPHTHSHNSNLTLQKEQQ